MATNSLPKIKKVIVSEISGDEQLDKVLTITKMPIGRYAQFMEELEKIPETIKSIAKMLLGTEVKKDDLQKAAEERGDKAQAEQIKLAEGITNDQIVEAVFAIPGILTKHWEDLISMLSIASGVEEEALRKLDIDEASIIVVAVIEVNNFFGIGDRFLEFMGRKNRMTVPPKKRKK